MTEKIEYQVDEHFTKMTQKERSKKGKNAYSTQQTLKMFGSDDNLDNTVHSNKPVEKQDTRSFNETHDPIKFLNGYGKGGKAEVIESNYVIPTKVMTI